MLTVWSVFWGNKYPLEYIYRLRAMVAANLAAPHRFRCLSDRAIDGIDCVQTTNHYIGWWQKINLFAIADGPSLYFDLDVVVTGSLDYLQEYTRLEFAAPANWGQSGHGGIQSSVMAWNGQWRQPVDRFDYQRDHKRLWGDQEYLTELRGDNFTRLPGVVSYKYHCRQGLPEDARVVAQGGRCRRDLPAAVRAHPAQAHLLPVVAPETAVQQYRSRVAEPLPLGIVRPQHQVHIGRLLNVDGDLGGNAVALQALLEVAGKI